MTKLYNEWMIEARALEAGLDTEWAEEHEELYEAFAEKCESAYNDGRLTDREFTELILTALYDYDGDLPEIDE